jgi:hypothetical protein
METVALVNFGDMFQVDRWTNKKTFSELSRKKIKVNIRTYIHNENKLVYTIRKNHK